MDKASKNKKDPINIFVGNNLKCFMEYNGISRRELAKSFGIEKNTLDKILSGSHALSGPYNAILLNEYDCDLNFIYGGLQYSEAMINNLGTVEKQFSKKERNKRIVALMQYMLNVLVDSAN